MFHSIIRSTAAAAIAATLAIPLGAMSAQAPFSSQKHETAQVEVTQGRAVLIGSEAGCQTIRKGDRQSSVGRSQLEIPTGSEARISWSGTCSVRIYGPSSIEWDNQGATLGLKFHEITWADFECRGGQHELFLPSEWSGTFGRSAFHVRGITGGPCEFRLQAGDPVSLQWEGNNRFSLPPLQLYPGSSVRLDRPRFMNSPVASAGSSGTWATEEDQFCWPWSPENGPGQPTGVRLGNGAGYEGATSASVPTGSESVVMAPEAEETCPGEVQTARNADLSDGIESTMCQEGLEPITYGQAPITSDAPTVQFEGTGATTPTNEATDGASVGPVPGDSKAQPDPKPEPGPTPEPTPEPEPEPEPEPAVFSSNQWRGFAMDDLNHAGSVVAERCSDVEYRILGQGRCKIIVSSSASQPRWCFTPKVDLQMQPGSVAIIEKDGTLRMSFGEVEEFQTPADRPAFDEFED